VIDDKPEIVSFIRELLTRRGYGVFGLSDSREALSTFQIRSTGSLCPRFRMPHIAGSVILDSFQEADRSVEVFFLTAEEETTLPMDLMRRD